MAKSKAGLKYAKIVHPFKCWKGNCERFQGSLKNQERTPRDAQIMLLDSGPLNYPENQHLTAQRSPKVVL